MLAGGVQVARGKRQRMHRHGCRTRPTVLARRLFIQSGKLSEIIPQLDTMAQKVARYALQTGKPRLASADDENLPVTRPGPTAEEYDALVKRIEDLERASIPPVAGAAEEESASVR